MISFPLKNPRWLRWHSQAHILSCDIQGLPEPLPKQVSQASFTLAVVQCSLTLANTVGSSHTSVQLIMKIPFTTLAFSPFFLEMS